VEEQKQQLTIKKILVVISPIGVVEEYTIAVVTAAATTTRQR